MKRMKKILGGCAIAALLVQCFAVALADSVQTAATNEKGPGSRQEQPVGQPPAVPEQNDETTQPPAVPEQNGETTQPPAMPEQNENSQRSMKRGQKNASADASTEPEQNGETTQPPAMPGQNENSQRSMKRGQKNASADASTTPEQNDETTQPPAIPEQNGETTQRPMMPGQNGKGARERLPERSGENGRPGSRAGQERRERAARRAKSQPDEATVDFQQLAQEGIISEETCEKILAYLEERAPGEGNLLDELVSAQIITEEERGAIDALRQPVNKPQSNA